MPSLVGAGHGLNQNNLILFITKLPSSRKIKSYIDIKRAEKLTKKIKFIRMRVGQGPWRDTFG